MTCWLLRCVELIVLFNICSYIQSDILTRRFIISAVFWQVPLLLLWSLAHLPFKLLHSLPQLIIFSLQFWDFKIFVKCCLLMSILGLKQGRNLLLEINNGLLILYILILLYQMGCSHILYLFCLVQYILIIFLLRFRMLFKCEINAFLVNPSFWNVLMFHPRVQFCWTTFALNQWFLNSIFLLSKWIWYYFIKVEMR